MTKTLIIVAHEDDEALIAGGYIKQNDCVMVITCISGRSTQIKAIIDNAVKYDFQYLPLNYEPFRSDNLPHLAKAITYIIGDERPDTVITHNPHDTHQEHKMVYNAVEIATRPILDYTPRRIMYGFGAGLYENADSLRFNPNTYLVMDEETLKTKMAMFDSYKMEEKGLRSSEGIEIEARFQGKMIGSKYAECFYLKREIMNYENL